MTRARLGAQGRHGRRRPDGLPSDNGNGFCWTLTDRPESIDPMNSAPPGARWSLDARVARPSGMPAPPPSGTAGIAGMRERAMLVGGRLSIESRPNQGTEVRLTVPVDRERA